MLKQFVFAAAACVFALSAQSAEPAMMTKHKLECAACHVDGVGKPVPTKQCQSCHPADKFEKTYEKKDGSANPHVPLHYDPALLDCALCHREHKESVNYCSACHADGLGFKVP